MSDLTVPDQPSPNTRNGFTYLYVAAAFAIVVAGMRAAETIINPLLLAIFLAVMSAPPYFSLLRRNVPNWLALLTVISVLTGLVLGVVWIVLGSVISFSSRQDHYTELLRERTAGLTEPLDRWLLADPAVADAVDDESEIEGASDSASDIDEAEGLEPSTTPIDAQNDANESQGASQRPSSEQSKSDTANSEDAAALSDATNISEPDDGNTDSDSEIPTSTDEDAPAVVSIPNNQFGLIPYRQPPPKDKQGWEALISKQFNPEMFISLTLSLLTELVQILSNAFLILLTVIFILLEVGTFRRKISDAFTHDEDLAARATQVVTSIQHYIVIKTWVSLGTGIFIALWLKFLGVPYAGLWGLLAFFFNFIPNIGSVLAAIPAVLIAWLELTIAPALAAAFGFALVNGVLGNFVEPRWMGKGLGLSPLVVFCSLVFWGWVLGPVGMLLSVPLTKTARIALDGFDDTRFVATLLSD